MHAVVLLGLTLQRQFFTSGALIQGDSEFSESPFSSLGMTLVCGRDVALVVLKQGKRASNDAIGWLR